MRRILLTTVILGGLSGLAWAETITTTVNGMVCAFCATGIEKTFRKQAEVATVKVDLPAKTVTITTKPDKTLNDAKIKEIVIIIPKHPTGEDRSGESDNVTDQHESYVERDPRQLEHYAKWATNYLP